MNLLTTYLKSFLTRSGSYVFMATVFARIISFLASILVLQFISNKELGVVLYAYNFILFIIPICGFGLHQSLIRYGALLKTSEEKNSLFIYVLKKGILASFILIFLIIVASFFFSFEFKNTQTYLIILSFILLPSFIFEIVRAQFRLNHDNKSYAYTELIHSLLLLISICLFSFFFKEIGYTLALLLTPLITSIIFFKKLDINFKVNIKLNITDFTFWKYGFFASLSNVLTQLLFVIDILLIGYLLKNSELITDYRYVSIIPFSLLFLPRVFINTDFVSFTEKIYDSVYIKNYIKSYMLLFLLISSLLILTSWLFSNEILSIIDSNFDKYSDTFLILIFGISGIFIFRGLFGNLLSSIGKAHVNYYIATIGLIINVISNYYLIPEYGIKGAAITSAILMWFTGILSCILFIILYKKDFSNK
ncbi:O-antigen/teichoic acid export membrane protein [Lutibacter sp. Hel_I_33_5]|uniref:oligosaccharide flippase family protein n=1 Tax=Lutibacter sp. Hel_I_33_5 TaxID=1566289 RepID=UPI0011A1A8A0|nr:polysaccharide biosynthesis C-terminal domain-containing protein [Lutibacter sp. Hel_I_33_5]TVZ56965.1 O-antigen/teichoic acid export membrane protein [Lutibacter sp. Hel_I_33_5]